MSHSTTTTVKEGSRPADRKQRKHPLVWDPNLQGWVGAKEPASTSTVAEPGKSTAPQASQIGALPTVVEIGRVCDSKWVHQGVFNQLSCSCIEDLDQWIYVSSRYHADFIAAIKNEIPGSKDIIQSRRIWLAGPKVWIVHPAYERVAIVIAARFFKTITMRGDERSKKYRPLVATKDQAAEAEVAAARESRQAGAAANSARALVLLEATRNIEEDQTKAKPEPFGLPADVQAKIRYV